MACRTKGPGSAGPFSLGPLLLECVRLTRDPTHASKAGNVFRTCAIAHTPWSERRRRSKDLFRQRRNRPLFEKQQLTRRKKPANSGDFSFQNEHREPPPIFEKHSWHQIGLMQSTHLHAHDIRRIAVEACRDPRTVAKILRGEPCSGTAFAAVKAAAERLGFNIAAPSSTPPEAA